jgi:hypothetical protein
MFPGIIFLPHDANHTQKIIAVEVGTCGENEVGWDFLEVIKELIYHEWFKKRF